MEIQPEDARALSDDTSPTQVPGDETQPDQAPVDPALLPSLPRSENQYNEDFNHYTHQFHNSTHGDWPVSYPRDEWVCRQLHDKKYWFYRAWFHYKTIHWQHQDIPFYKSTPGYFIDDHPSSSWPNLYSRIWGTRGWQLVLSADDSYKIWQQCEEYETLLRQEEARIAAEAASSASNQDDPAPRRGHKRQAVDNLEQIRVEYQIDSILQDLANVDVSQLRMLQGLPPPEQQQIISGVVHSLTSYSEELQQVCPSDIQVIDAAPPDHVTAAASAPQDLPTPSASTNPILEGTGLPVPIPDSGSMSLTSTSTESQHTLEPPFPLGRPRD